MTWNTNIPEVANELANDWPDINENFAALYAAGAVFLTTMRYGIFERGPVTYNGGSVAYTVKIGGSSYWVKDKYAYWTAELTTAAIGTPSADTWYYLYLDYSAITSNTAITNAEFYWSSSAPSWNGSYRGWYNGDDRCILAALSNSGPTNIVEFFQDGDTFVWADAFLAASYITPSDTWTDVDLSAYVPAFCKRAICTGRADYTDADSTCVWRTNGQTGTGGHVMNPAAATAATGTVGFLALTDSSQVIEVRWVTATSDKITIYVDGWILPLGM
jgi:hypothetical protein